MPILVFLLLLWLSALPALADTPPLRVGVVFSQTGTMAQSEQPLINATLKAINEINQGGGLQLNNTTRKIEPVVVDGASDPIIFGRQVELLVSKGVRIFFGCWTSASRKQVAKVLEKDGGLLFYPMQYEGYERSKAVVYTGLTANQQLFPVLQWLLRSGRHRVFLVGSDYVFPRTANKLARQFLKAHGAQVVGEAYRPLGDQNFKHIVEEARKSGAQAILSTINGDSQAGFFQAYDQAGLKPELMPVVSLSMAEVEASAIKPIPAGHFAAWAYFQSLDYPYNRRFRYNNDLPILDDPIVTAYWQVLAFARAVKKANSTEYPAVRQAIRGVILDTPGGLVRIDPDNFHSWRVVRIGRILQDGQFEVVWSSELPVQPQPYPKLP